jgi:hypothetical protein
LEHHQYLADVLGGELLLRALLNLVAFSGRHDPIDDRSEHPTLGLLDGALDDIARVMLLVALDELGQLPLPHLDEFDLHFLREQLFCVDQGVSSFAFDIAHHALGHQGVGLVPQGPQGSGSRGAIPPEQRKPPPLKGKSEDTIRAG